MELETCATKKSGVGHGTPIYTDYLYVMAKASTRSPSLLHFQFPPIKRERDLSVSCGHRHGCSVDPLIRTHRDFLTIDWTVDDGGAAKDYSSAPQETTVGATGPGIP